MTERTQHERSEAGDAERADGRVSGRTSSRRRRLLVLATVAVVVIAAVAGAAVWFFGRNTDSSAKSNASNATSALTAGLQAQTKGDLAGATTQYNKVLSYDRNNKYALYDLALIDSANSDYGLAEAKYRRVLAVDAAYEPALFNLAILVQAKGDRAGAITLYNGAVKAAPKDASAHLNLGLLLRSAGNRPAGNAQVKIATRLNTRLVDPAHPAAKTGPATTGLPSPSSTP